MVLSLAVNWDCELHNFSKFRSWLNNEEGIKEADSATCAPRFLRSQRWNQNALSPHGETAVWRWRPSVKSPESKEEVWRARELRAVQGAAVLGRRQHFKQKTVTTRSSETTTHKSGLKDDDCPGTTGEHRNRDEKPQTGPPPGPRESDSLKVVREEVAVMDLWLFLLLCIRCMWDKQKNNSFFHNCTLYFENCNYVLLLELN